MKKTLLSICFGLLLSGWSFAQISPDFTANDCSGNSHNLYSELNSGKVIVLAWVMPCGACVSASLTTYNVVQSYQSGHPNTVYMYLCDDYANTSCASLNSWKNSNSLTNATTFSNSAINMSNYGSTGMPKFVVIGGANHTVFYNSNNTVNATSLQNAINSALLTTGLNGPNNAGTSLNIYPNPAGDRAEIKFNLVKESEVAIELFNIEGQLMQNIYSGKLSAGENKVELTTASLASGMYLVKFTEGDKARFMNVVVSH